MKSSIYSQVYRSMANINFELKIEKLTVLTFIFIFAVSFALFYPSLNYYFFQDDWFVLNWVRTGDFKSFLLPHKDTIYYRPLSMPFFFWGLYQLFGLKVIYYHVFVFVLFSFLITI